MKCIDSDGSRVGLSPEPASPDQWYFDTLAILQAAPKRWTKPDVAMEVFRSHYMKANPETYLDEPGDQRDRLIGLLVAAEAVLIWARTPQNHGGNPYCHEFVKLAAMALGRKDW